jgi:hypothetical protein
MVGPFDGIAPDTRAIPRSGRFAVDMASNILKEFWPDLRAELFT